MEKKYLQKSHNKERGKKAMQNTRYLLPKSDILAPSKAEVEGTLIYWWREMNPHSDNIRKYITRMKEKWDKIWRYVEDQWMNVTF